MRALFLALTATTLTLATAASAAEWKAGAGKSIDLGSFKGSAYYTTEQDGYRVVATLASVNSGADHPQVIRLATTLKGDQTVHLSIPGTVGADGSETTIAFKRSGNIVEIAAAE
ncbi:hypothetical protein [Methylobacterium gnaphalii]|uniref:Uncharacterized protein n=1 Tax=Methylobacterium gnaphalii TaxID=1010610 RepID=A0A512JG73_9HYPH|nr:hypothetical protein [Methylobacterium gnaphalii]GEP08949.1 hypothetical protein MGN01_07940 [Methylobacterium gnaphalii]GJD67491.1 hypothetical protein MMMDOFMJ_0406 [Methylobacterium gnaphalii]GLS48182.1 hypothetical protein GCM10007885_10260 [Methylobacterium gnaphalii]